MRVQFVISVLASILILGTLGLTQNTDAQSSAFDVIYTADTLPEDAGFSERIPDGNGACILREILPGGIYHFTSPDVGFCSQSADVWNADSVTGFTVEVRAKVNSYSGNPNQGGLAIWATAPDSDSILLLREDSIRSFWSGQIFLMDTVSDFHTYRITVQGNSHTVYVDGVSVFTGPTVTLNRNELIFGDNSNGAGGDAEWDCVAYTTSGAFSPSELAPACVEVTFDSLREQILALDLPDGLTNALISKVDAAEQQFENGNFQAAINILEAYVNQAEAQTGKKIDAADAAELIETADVLVDFIAKEIPE